MEETARLACVIDQCTDDHLSHAGYRTVEAAEALDESYPEQAARLWRARSGHRERGEEQAVRRCGGILRPGAEVLRRGRAHGLLGPARGPSVLAPQTPAR